MKRTAAFLILGTLMLGARPAPGVEATGIKIYDASEIAPTRYTVVKRLWTESARSMFWIGTEDSQAAAADSLMREAASLGADGVVNLHCVRDGGTYCYGLAIKLK